MKDSLYVEFGVCRLAYDVAGNGPLVICVPGMGDLRSEYRFLVPRLVAAGYRVVTMDVRGHGDTSAYWDDYSVAGVGSDILALVRDMESGPAVIIGTSMAAGAAVWAAYESPQAIRGMVLIGPAVRGEVKGVYRLLMGVLFMRPWGPAAWRTYYSRLYPRYKPEDFENHAAAIEANLKEPGRMRALRRMILASKRASENRLSQVKAPVLVLMGSLDSDFSDAAAEADRVAGALKGESHLIADSGHYPHIDKIDDVVPLVLPFLERVTEKEAVA